MNGILFFNHVETMEENKSSRSTVNMIFSFTPFKVVSLFYVQKDSCGMVC